MFSIEILSVEPSWRAENGNADVRKIRLIILTTADKQVAGIVGPLQH